MKLNDLGKGRRDSTEDIGQEVLLVDRAGYGTTYESSDDPECELSAKVREETSVLERRQIPQVAGAFGASVRNDLHDEV